MKTIYDRMIHSIRFWANVRHRKKQINPEIREILEDYHTRKRQNVNKLLVEEEIKINTIKNTYEYKCFEHFQKINFLKTKENSDEFVLYCNFDIMNEKSRWTRSPIFFRYFHIPRDFMLNIFRKLILFLTALFFFKLGLIHGYKDSLLYDEIKENIIDIRTEDQLLDLLNKKGLPILVLYYYPGDLKSTPMMEAQGKFIEKYGEGYVTMAKVNCKYNLDLCLKKVQYLILPQWEMMYPPYVEVDQDGNDVKKFPVLPSKFNRSLEGLEGFLMEQGIIEDKYNPMIILNKSMRKYI
jgi:hypothetical protein